MPSPRPAIVLLSGGMDSATCLAVAKEEGYRCYALSFRYGQRHAVELEAAKRVATALKVKEHRIVDIDLRAFGGSALTADLEVPKDRSLESIGDGIPITYVPARNTIFLSYALAWAEVLHANDIFIGVNAVDYSGYPDCRPEFIAAFQATARLGTTLSKLNIHTPLVSLHKAGIVSRGLELGLDFSLTRSCYDPTTEGVSCGHCDACILRLHLPADRDHSRPAQLAQTRRLVNAMRVAN